MSGGRLRVGFLGLILSTMAPRQAQVDCDPEPSWHNVWMETTAIVQDRTRTGILTKTGIGGIGSVADFGLAMRSKNIDDDVRQRLALAEGTPHDVVVRCWLSLATCFSTQTASIWMPSWSSLTSKTGILLVTTR